MWMLKRRRANRTPLERRNRVMATNVATPRRAAHRRPAVPAAFAVVMRGWERLGAPVVGRKVPGTRIVAVLAAMVGYLACLYTIGHGTNLDYSDAQSHLTIAR